MHLSYLPICAGVFSLLQTTTARPAKPDFATAPVNPLTGETTLNDTDIQTFPTTSTTSSTFTARQHVNETVIRAGNYNIAFCGNQTQQVREDLQLLWGNLQGVEQATAQGTTNAAFQAFFKDNTYEHYIGQMFQNITTGAALLKPNSSTPSTLENPTIACLTGPGQAMESTSAGSRDLYGLCAGNPKYAAFYRASSSWIFLCPEYFTFPQKTPQPAQFCPKVIDNYFVQPTWMNLVRSQMYILMHEILHFYLDSASWPAKDSALEVTDINVAYNLAALDAISNAESYVIYDAMVSANCSDYPAPTDSDPDECSGECLPKLGSPAADVVSIGNLTINGMNIDTMSFGNSTSTYQSIVGIAQAL